MSLEAFQRAFAHLVASPVRCLEVREDASLLDDYALDARDRRRLLAMVGHRGMSHHCTLYRANRLTPIARSLPRTCVRLGPRLATELDAFWAMHPDSELQFKRESERFAAFLLERVRQGVLSDATLAEDIQSEMQALELRFGGAFHP